MVDLVFSDHLTQIVRINIGKRKRRTKTTARRQFAYSSIEEFKHPLSKELWNDVFNRLDVNSSLEAFLDTFLHCFNIAFPYKRGNLRERSNKRWISKGLIVSSKRMQTINNLKRKFARTREALIYIEKYQRIYKRVLREAKKEIMAGMLESQ